MIPKLRGRFSQGHFAFWHARYKSGQTLHVQLAFEKWKAPFVALRALLPRDWEVFGVKRSEFGVFEQANVEGEGPGAAPVAGSVDGTLALEFLPWLRLCRSDLARKASVEHDTKYILITWSLELLQCVFDLA